MNNRNTFGGILIKCDSKSEVLDKEINLRKFLTAVGEGQNGRNVGEPHEACGNACSNACRVEGNLTCDKIKIVACATLVGFYDFIIIIRTHDIEALERFVLYCLKSGAKAELISDSQTLAGTFFFPEKDEVVEVAEQAV